MVRVAELALSYRVAAIGEIAAIDPQFVPVLTEADPGIEGGEWLCQRFVLFVEKAIPCVVNCGIRSQSALRRVGESRRSEMARGHLDSVPAELRRNAVEVLHEVHVFSVVEAVSRARERRERQSVFSRELNSLETRFAGVDQGGEVVHDRRGDEVREIHPECAGLEIELTLERANL